jgi:hypothetical protein
MRVFLLSLLAVAALGFASSLLLNSVQKSASQAFSTQGVRLSEK